MLYHEFVYYSISILVFKCNWFSLYSYVFHLMHLKILFGKESVGFPRLLKGSMSPKRDTGYRGCWDELLVWKIKWKNISKYKIIRGTLHDLVDSTNTYKMGRVESFIKGHIFPVKVVGNIVFILAFVIASFVCPSQGKQHR